MWIRYFGIENALKISCQKVKNPPLSIPSPSTWPFGSQGHHNFQSALLLRSVEPCTSVLQLHVQPHEIGGNPFLSDCNPAIIALCSTSSHFLCSRYVIKSFGPNSRLARIVRCLMFFSTEDGFRLDMEAWAYDLLEIQKTGNLDSDPLQPLRHRYVE
jgi:hypothetical protein